MAPWDPTDFKIIEHLQLTFLHLPTKFGDDWIVGGGHPKALPEEGTSLPSVQIGRPINTDEIGRVQGGIAIGCRLTNTDHPQREAGHGAGGVNWSSLCSKDKLRSS